MTVKLIKEKPASTIEIHELEARLFKKLPATYVRFVLSSNGAKPELNIFEIGDNNNCTVNQFIPISEIQKIIKNSWYEFGEKIPIAWAEGGNFILLELVNDGKILFWDHESPDVLLDLAPNIDDFLEKLRPFSNASFEAESHEVKHVWIDPEFLKSLEREQPEILINKNNKNDKDN